MPNKYFSVDRRFWAVSVCRDTLAAPADFEITAGIIGPKFFSINQAEVNPNSNMVISRVGLFSNFADGLVWKQYQDRIWIAMTAYAYDAGVAISGVSTLNGASPLITGGGGTAYLTDLAAGDVITNGTFIWQVSSVFDDNTAFTREFLERTQGSQTLRKLTLLGSDTLRIFEVRTLNDMYEFNEFITPSIFATTAVNYVTIEVTLIIADAETAFLTKSIDTAFNGDTVHFDVGIDLEFTERG